MRKAAILLAAALALGALPAAAQQAPIKIGEINSYTGMAAFTGPYKNGWTLAVEEINAAGGIGGRKLEVVWRDDALKPEDAVRAANELVSSEKVALLAGGFLSNVGLALADFAAQSKIVYIASEPLSDALVWAKGNPFTFRLRPSTYMQAAMLAEEAAKLPAKRWATIAPNYEYGQSAVAAFRKLLQEKRPDVTFVAEQWPALNKIEAGPTVQALLAAAPDAVFNVEFGPDLPKFVREGEARGLFKDRPVVSMLTGEPEYMDPLKDETPIGWIVTGYPWDQIETAEHAAFREAYRRRFNDYPRVGSVVGYATIKAIAAGLKKAGSTETPKLIAAFEGLAFETPFGPAEFRREDHQSTMGAFVGKTAVKDGKGTMTGWRYAEGARYLPSEAEVKKLRPQ